MTDLSTLTQVPKEVLTQESLGGLKVQSVSEARKTVNIMIYGPPGVGKTVLCGSATKVEDMCPVLLIDVEGGTMSLQGTYPDVEVVRVQSWKDMQNLYNELYAMEHEYKTVVLDSLTEVQKFSMYNIMTDLLKEHPDRDPDVPSIREWGKNIEQTRRLVRAFRDLPVSTIMTALSMSERDTRSGMTLIRPSLSGKLASEVSGFLDIVGYMYTKLVEGENKRLLLTQPTDTQVAKDRTGKLPVVVEDPTMAVLSAAVFTPES